MSISIKFQMYVFRYEQVRKNPMHILMNKHMQTMSEVLVDKLIYMIKNHPSYQICTQSSTYQTWTFIYLNLSSTPGYPYCFR